jgi:hypothetical protein
MTQRDLRSRFADMCQLETLIGPHHAEAAASVA